MPLKSEPVESHSVRQAPSSGVFGGQPPRVGRRTDLNAFTFNALTMPHRLTTLAALTLVLWAGVARAQASGALARALFHEGRELMESEDYTRACPKLEESLRLDPGIGTRFNLAHCWEKLGRTASAWTTFLDVAAEARKSQQPEKAAVARERAEALEPRLCRLRVDVQQPVSEIEITLDGQPLRRAAWGTPSPVDPGAHEVRATAARHESWSQTLEISEPAPLSVISVPALSPASPSTSTSTTSSTPPPAPTAAAPKATNAPPPEPTPDAVPARGSLRTSVGWFATGTGAVATGAAGAFFLVARSKRSQTDSLCTGGTDGNQCVRDQQLPTWDGGAAERAEYDTLVEEAGRYDTLSLISLGVGVGFLATGIYLLVTAPDDGPSDEAHGVSLLPTAGPFGWGASVSGHF